MDEDTMSEAGTESESFETQEYKALVERYKVKKTTDDCYTPKNVFAAMSEWAARQYGFDTSQIVRPFWPGGDYETFAYPSGCIVVDNPPFSILSKIIRFYNEGGIRFFLFAPTLTCFNAGRDRCNYVITDVTLTYHNGAKIRTSFVTNMGEYAIFADPSLDAILTRCEEENTHRKVRKLVGVDYPVDVATTSNISAIVRQGNEYKVKKGECAYISHVGEQRQSIFGGGLLLSKKAAEDKAAEDKAAEDKAAEDLKRARRVAIVLSKDDRRRQSEIGRFRNPSTPTQMELF